MTVDDDAPTIKGVIGGTAAVIVTLVVIIALCIAGAAGCRSYNRSQARKDAENQVKITHINIKKANQQAKINYAQINATRAEAQKRYVESVGIRRAQDEIAATLTDRYLQHEAIRAQLEMAASGKNNTSIYIPSGQNGVPIVATRPPGR